MFPVLILALLVLPGRLFPQTTWQYDKDADRQFSSALRHFSRGEYAEATSEFGQLIRLPRHHRTTAAFVMLGKSHFQAGQHRESIKVLKQFIDTYPESYYIDDAYYTLGLSYEAQRRLDDALVQFLSAAETADDGRLRKRALYFCEVVADKLTAGELADILGDVHPPESQDFIRIKSAEKYLAAGNVVLAEQALQSAVQRTPPSSHYPRIQALAQKIRMGVSVRVGVLLPLMTRAGQKHLKQFGEDFLQGMQFGLDEQRSRYGALIGVTLDVRDTERDPTVAVKHTQELVEQENVVGIVGPIFNNEAIACAGIADAKLVPLITPTANADGIAAVGPYIFQANPDMTTHGRAAAQYAVNGLGLVTLAVVAPSDGNGKAMSDAFAQEASSLGARLVATERYAPGATDLRPQLLHLRRVALAETEPLISFADPITQPDIMHMVEAGVRLKVIDSLMDRGATMSVFQLFGSDGKRIADSLRLPTFVPEIKVEALDSAATGIQGIYAPINDGQAIAILTSQLAYYNIKAQVLGSNDWYNTVELDANRRYADGVVFFSDFYLDGADDAYANFAKLWFEKTKRKITTNAVLGYDVIQLVTSAIYNGSTTRETLARALATYEKVLSLHNTVTFRKDRVNTQLHVLQFKDGVVKAIGKVSVQ